MRDAITDVQGIEVGHAQDLEALTGCTVVLCREGAVVGVDVRGAAPGTRETDLCRPGTLVERAHAVFLAGGSAFGLEVGTGIMQYLREQGIGFRLGPAVVPIVPGAILFDLGIGEPTWPDASMGYQACKHAGAGEVEEGNVGAGTGASVGKILGPGGATKAGLGTASIRFHRAAGDDLLVGALVVVNAVGNVVRPGTDVVLAGARDPGSNRYVDSVRLLLEGIPAVPDATNTTLGVVATDAALTVEQINWLAQVAHDGLARVIRPAHTPFDGDTFFGLATGGSRVSGPHDMMALGAATVNAVERAVVRAIERATPAGGLPASIHITRPS